MASAAYEGGIRVPAFKRVPGSTTDRQAPLTAVISLNHVAMEFPDLQGLGSVQALEGVSFDFRDNEFVVALGASGCGKTTLLNVIAGYRHSRALDR